MVSLIVNADDFVLALSGEDNTFSGGATIESGAVAIFNDEDLGAGAVTFDGVVGATLTAIAGMNLANSIAVTASTTATIGESDSNAA